MQHKVVLVVEDEDTLREMIQMMIEDLFGAATIPAEDGIQALELARDNHPDLILLDIMIPRLNGLEVASRLKASPATSNIPIVAVTASATSDKAIAAGCNDYLAKPFDIEVFAGKVRHHLAQPVAWVAN